MYHEYFMILSRLCADYQYKHLIKVKYTFYTTNIILYMQKFEFLNHDSSNYYV